MNTLRDLLGMNPLRPLIAFGGDGGGGGGGSDDKPAKTNQDRINEIYAASDDPWESNGAELNELVNDRSGTYSGGSTTTTTSSSNDDKPAPQSQAKKTPSPAPAPTVVKTGTTLKTGTVLNSKDDPVVFTPKDDGGYIGQNQSTLPAAEPETFGDAFAENRAAGNETFTYNGNLYTTELASETPVNEVRTLPSGTEYYVDASGQFAGLVPDSTPASPVSYDAFGNAYDTTAGAAQADQVAEAQSASAQNAIAAETNRIFDPRGDQIQSPTSNGAGIASLGEDDVMSQPVVTSASQEYLDSLPDFSYDFTADDAGSPLPGPNVVADASGYAGMSQADFVREADAVGYLPVVDTTPYYDAFGNEYGSKTGAALADIVAENATADGYAGMSQADFVREADAVGYLPVVDATPSYDAFGNAYPTAEQAAQADIDANNAAVIANNPDFVPQYPGDVPEGIISSSADIAPEQGLSGSDLLKYTAIGLPANVGEMATGLGENLNLTSPLNTLQGFNQQNVGLMSIPVALTNRILEAFMSPEEKQRRILAADPNRQGSSISTALTDSGDFLTNTVSPYISDFLNPGSQQAVFEGDLGGNVSVTGVDGTNLTGPEAIQGIGNTVSAEGVSDAALDMALSSNPYTRAFSGALNAGEQLSGFGSDISAQIDNAYVSGALDDNQVFKDALAAQNGDVDNALAAVKNLAYSDGYSKIAASGAAQGLIPGMKPGIVGVAKEGLKQGGVEAGQGAYEGYQAISSINNVLGTDFDPTKNIVGNALTEGVSGTGAVVVAGGANALSARQRRNAADEEALMSQPVVAPYGGMDTSGITPGFKQGRSSSSAGSPGTIEGQFTVYDPNLSPTAGEPASSTVSTAYDLEGPEAGLAITDQRDPMTTSMETMAAQEIINDQVNQTGTVDFGILQRIQNATGLSMNELGSMVDSATSTKLTPDQIAAIESAPVGDVMTNAPVAPGFDDEVTGNFGGSNISVRPNPDGTTTLTAPSGRISVVEPGQDLDQAIKVFDEIVTPIDVQTDAPVLQSSGQGLASLDTAAIDKKMDADNAAPVKTFTTAKGSTYDAFGDGTTVRNRAERTKFGRPDGEVSGVQPRSQQTVFMTKEAANEIGPLFQNTQIPTELVIDGDKAKLVHKEDYGPKKAGSDASATVTLSTEPEVGLQPVEIMNTSNDNIRNIHFGNEITEVSTVDADQAITNKMDSDNTFAEVSDAQAVANAEAIKAQEVAYTETKAATGSDSAAEAAGEAAYNSSIAASSVTETDDGGAEVEIADNLFEAANKADQDVVTVNADGTATVAVDPNAVETGTDVAVVPETTTDVTTDTDGTTDVVVDGTTDLTTAATTDLTVDGDTDTDTDTTAVTVVDNTIDGTATEISGAITDQTTDNDTSPKVVVVPDTKVLTEVEPPEDEEVEVEVEEEVKPGGDVTVDLDEDDTFVPVITSTDENGETITECPEGYTMVEGPDGPMCQKSVTATRQRAGAGTRAYTGLAGNIGRTGPGQRRKTTTLTERVRPTVRSA
jgi:hypothetical protein